MALIPGTVDATRDSKPASWEFPPPTVEPTQRRIRVRFGNRLIADSRRAQLLLQYLPGPRLPTYFLPLDDVRPGVLVNEHRADEGTVRWSVRVGDRLVENAAWMEEHPAPELAALAGHVTFAWNAVEWYEEDEQVFVHARDPYKRVDVLRSSRRLRVEVEGHTLAETTRPSLLFETSLPTRYYIPPEDVRLELLEPSDTISRCPYKGVARFWSARVGERLLEDVVWSYPDPIPENPKIRDLLCFFNERVDLFVDGGKLERPRTPWS